MSRTFSTNSGSVESLKGHARDFFRRRPFHNPGLQRRLDLFCVARLAARQAPRERARVRVSLTVTARARHCTALDKISRLIWRAPGEGYLPDAITGRRWRTNPRSREFGMAAKNLFVS